MLATLVDDCGRSTPKRTHDPFHCDANRLRVMHEIPTPPTVDDAPADLTDSGHLWLTELVDGGPLRFQIRDSGLLRFGDETREYGDAEDLPAPYRAAVRHVREALDRDALRAAVDDVEAVTFVGVATLRRSIDYDWTEIPPFLGTDVWSADTEEFRPPDAAQGIFERLGLEPVNAVARELPTRDFDPSSFEVPESAWYDGPAAGVVIRKKGGGRAVLRNAEVGTDGATADGATDDPDVADASADELAARFASPERLERFASELAADEQSVTADALADRAVEAAAREAAPAFDRGVEPAAVRSEAAALARAFLDERPNDAW